MRKMKDRMAQLLMLGLLGISFAFTFGQLTMAQQQPKDPPACNGLRCTTQEDCGRSCFCNRPSGFCIAE
jgi:hypothetical protein